MYMPFTSFRSLLLAFLVSSPTLRSQLIGSKDDYSCVGPTVGDIKDRRTDKSKLRVVTYNVDFLFIDQGPMCPSTNCTWVNQSEAIKHADQVANVIEELQPDILNLCEVEGCDELSYIQKSINDVDYRHYLIRGTDNFTGQNVALLTKIDPELNLNRTTEYVEYPIPDSGCGYTGPSGKTGVSKHYYAIISVGELKVALIGAHLLAIPTDPKRCAQREGQATILRTVIDSMISQGYEVIFYGDLNDFDGDIPDINSNKPTSKVLSILKGDDLISVANFMPQPERYTDWWDREEDCEQDPDDLSAIDHILVSRTLASKVKQASVFHGYTQYCGTYNSDHWPLVVDFEF